VDALQTLRIREVTYERDDLSKRSGEATRSVRAWTKAVDSPPGWSFETPTGNGETY